jgi:hypothetical protein
MQPFSNANQIAPMDQIVPCWLCGAPADSAEHIFKARDLRRLFDRDGYAPDKLPFHFHGDGHARIRGPKADRMKYPKLICKPCNNDRTSDFDRAYDQLSDWFARQQANYSLSHIDFRAVFGGAFETGIDAFRRHCAKSLGCRILASGYMLPRHFPNPLYDSDIRSLQISICRAQPLRDVQNYFPEMMERVLGKGDLYANLSRSHLEATGESLVRNAIWWENVGHFQINYWFCIAANPRCGPLIDGSPLYSLTEYDLGLSQMKEEMFAWLS